MIGKNILHYQILNKLGEGGMGVVYKAKDTKLKRDVAIKFLPKHVAESSEERERFKIEAQAAAALNHPNIATIYSIEETSDDIFFVMEFIDGVELKDKIEKETFPLNDALSVASHIADGLSVAHKKGVIHRDIKSSNIMMTNSGLIKIMDFGLAKVTGSEFVTRLGTTLGTAAYMSPEQARGESVDNRTDIWSLGVIMYEMLTGQLPFRAEHEAAWTYLIVNENPPFPSELNENLPPQVDAIVMKLLEKDKGTRYQNAEEISKDIKNFDTKAASAKQDTSEKAIAVLPFKNMSPDKETDYIGDGLAEELIVNLSRLKEIKLVPWTNTARYKGTDKDLKTLGRELRARYILQGSVRKFGDDLRISVQLMDVAKESQLWGETYKGKFAEVFDIQEHVSKQIADMLMIKLSPSDKAVLTKRATENTEAFDLYLRARDFLNKLTKNTIQFAIQLFSKAIELDKRYAAAYAGLSEAYAQLYFGWERSEDLLEKAIDSGLRALMYDPELAEAYVALSMAYYNKKLYEEAQEAGKKALELNEGNHVAYWVLGRIFHSMDDDKQAVELYEKVIDINPDFYAVYNDLSIAYERLGDTQNFNNTLKRSMNIFPKYLTQHPDDARGHLFYAHNLAKLGKTDQAKEVGKTAYELNPTDAVMSYNLACLFSLLNEREEAVDFLKKACKSGYQNYEWIKRDSDFDNIRKEPGYTELLKGK